MQTAHTPQAHDCEPAYLPTTPEAIRAAEDAAIARAIAICTSRLRKTSFTFDSPGFVKTFLALRLSTLEAERFEVLYLNSQHQLIEAETAFLGTLSQTSVYPREIVKRALALNAAAVIFSHNHPSGHVEPSRADEHLTQTLKVALALVDVRVLDHIIVAGNSTLSMSERGLL